MVISNVSYMDATETCRVLEISPRTLGRRVKAGKMPQPVRKGGRRYWPAQTVHELAVQSRKPAATTIGAPDRAGQVDQQPVVAGGAQ
jgi:hypothetical protein